MLTAHAAALAVRPRPPVAEPVCRLCGSTLHRSLIDLGCQPLANRTTATGSSDGPAYPLHVRICDACKLMQVSDVAPPESIAAAPCRSSRSATGVVQHRRTAEILHKRLKLGSHSLVIEIGSSDSILLRHFQAASVPVLRIEPASTAAAAEPRMRTEIGRFAGDTAMEIAVCHGRADLIVADDVLQHVPDLFDFAAGFASILKPNGVLSLQVPHLLSIVQRVQFDAFRHDSYNYFSLQVLERVLRAVGLRVFDAERIPDHGGSLRVQACHVVCPLPARPGLKSVRLAEAFAELDRGDLFSGFSGQVAAACEEVRDFLRIHNAAGRRVAAYGATTRGSTMLNACGITTDEISCVADPDPARHGRFLPGSHIPIVPLEALREQPPDDILVLPWIDAAEVAVSLQSFHQAGTQLWTPIPRITRL